MDSIKRWLYICAALVGLIFKTHCYPSLFPPHMQSKLLLYTFPFFASTWKEGVWVGRQADMLYTNRSCFDSCGLRAELEKGKKEIPSKESPGVHDGFWSQP